jgi:hypothetical protein
VGSVLDSNPLGASTTSTSSFDFKYLAPDLFNWNFAHTKAAGWEQKEMVCLYV